MFHLQEFVLPENLVGIDPDINKLTEGNCYSFKNLIVKEFKYSKYLSMSAVTELEEVKDKDAPIVGSAYWILAYRCAIARIGIGKFVADIADCGVACANK